MGEEEAEAEEEFFNHLGGWGMRQDVAKTRCLPPRGDTLYSHTKRVAAGFSTASGPGAGLYSSSIEVSYARQCSDFASLVCIHITHDIVSM